MVDDDRIIRESLREFLSLEGFATEGAETVREALRKIDRQSISLVIADINLPDGDGLGLLEAIRQHHAQTAIVMITGYGSIETAVAAMKQGACDYLTKPILDDQLRIVIHRALQRRSDTREEGKPTPSPRQGLEQIITKDPKMAKVMEVIAAVADSDITVLMTGPSGTGKSMFARTLHHQSGRTGPFVEVSCGALPETLLESELFGHVRGAFTGAVSHKEGKFLAAHTGTIFLDEIGNASPGLQAKLLRIVQEREFEPVGSNKTITVDTRIVLATNRDLTKEVEEGRFREDLYYRVNVVTIELPPLHHRQGDIPLLAQHFLQVFAARHRRPKRGISDEAMALMQLYQWSGNVRELENVVERAVLLSKGPLIEPKDLPAQIRQAVESVRDVRPRTLRDAKVEPERQLILHALEANQWNRQKTAQSLGINRTTLYKKMKKYDLDT